MIKIVQRFGRIATFALSFLISLIIVRLYGTEVMGNYTYLMTIITFLILLVSFGSNQTILSSFEKSNVDKAIKINIKLYLFTFTLLLIIGSVLMYFNMILKEKDFYYLLILFSVVFIAAISNIFKYTSIVKEKVEEFYFIDIGLYLSLLSCISVFSYLNIDILFVIATAYTLFFILFYFIYKSEIHIKEILFDTKLEMSYLKNSFYSLLATVFLMLSYKFNIFYIEANYTKSELGLYVISMIMIDTIIMFLASFMLVDINKLKNSNFIYIGKYIGKYIALSILILIFINFYGYQVLELVYDVNDRRIEEFLNIMKFTIPVILVLKVIQNYFIINNKIKIYLLSGFIFLVSLLIINNLNRGDVYTIMYNYVYSSIIVVIFSLIFFLYSKKEVT